MVGILECFADIDYSANSTHNFHSYGILVVVGNNLLDTRLGQTDGVRCMHHAYLGSDFRILDIYVPCL